MSVSYGRRLKPICGGCAGEPVEARDGSQKATSLSTWMMCWQWDQEEWPTAL